MTEIQETLLEETRLKSKVFSLESLLPPPPFLRLRVKYGGWDRDRGVGVRGPFLILRIAYMPNLSLLKSL